MNAKACLVLGLVALGMVALGGFVLAEEYVWDGDGPVIGGTWTDQGDWVLNSGFPDDSNDNVYLEDVSPSATCTYNYNPSTALTVNNVTITGSSPTKMTLHVKDDVLMPNNLDLNDYAEVDVDMDFEVSGNYLSTMSGSVWADVATGTVFNVEFLTIDGSNTILNLTTAGTGVLEVEKIFIDAHAADASRSLKLVGGNVFVADTLGFLTVKSDQDTDDHRAKFWLASGSITWDCDGDLILTGGPNHARRCEIDLDVDLDTTSGNYVVTWVTGVVSVDIAAAKTFKASKLVLKGPNCALRVAAGSGAKLETSVPVGCP